MPAPRSHLLILILGTLVGCRASDPAEPVRLDPGSQNGTAEISVRLPPGAFPLWLAEPAFSRWKWVLGDLHPQQGQICGIARLETGGSTGPDREGLHYCWTFQPPLPRNSAGSPLLLTPDDPDGWHTIRATAPAGSANMVLLPLPRLELDSGLYSDLVDFLGELTGPHFGSIVCHWPKFPIPVRTGHAVSGDLDLAACLAEAVTRWNEGESRPWFQLEEAAGWGVRLVHFPGAILRPPLLARITRLDGQGRPLRINIIIGDNYDDPWDRKYAIRGLVHELGHALFLWGHSRDRLHVLWGAAPPLVDFPSPDERKAAHLWHGLPEDIDLGDYISAP